MVLYFVLKTFAKIFNIIKPNKNSKIYLKFIKFIYIIIYKYNLLYLKFFQLNFKIKAKTKCNSLLVVYLFNYSSSVF